MPTPTLSMCACAPRHTFPRDHSGCSTSWDSPGTTANAPSEKCTEKFPEKTPALSSTTKGTTESQVMVKAQLRVRRHGHTARIRVQQPTWRREVSREVVSHTVHACRGHAQKCSRWDHRYCGELECHFHPSRRHVRHVCGPCLHRLWHGGAKLPQRNLRDRSFNWFHLM